MGWKRSLLFGRVCAAGVLLCVMLAACASATLSDVWQAPDFRQRQLGDVLVVGFSANKTGRIAFEQGFVRHLRDRGIRAESSYNVVMREFPTRAAVDDYVHRAGIRYVVLAKYTGVNEHIEQVPAQLRVNYYGGYYPRFSGYGEYWGSTSVRYNEAYTDKRSDVLLETSIFEVASEKLVWEGRSKSFEAGSVSHAANELAGVILKKID